jgi:outer membrane receptor protein involved in Fe transport
VLGDFVTPGHQDTLTGIDSVNVSQFTRWRRRHLSIDSALAHTTSNFLMGMHEFKGGVQLSTGESVTDTAWPSNTQFLDAGGQPFEMSVREPTLSAGHVRTNGAFLQDTWSMTDRLTLNLGVRYDRGVSDIQATQQMDNLLKNKNGAKYPAIPDLITMSTLSPRLGATVKLDQAATTVVKISGGRYYRKMTSSDASSQSPGALTTFVYGWNPATRAYDILKRTSVPSNNNRIDPDHTNEYTDQVHVGLERQLATNFGINVMGIYKRERNRIGTLDTTSVFAPREYIDTFNGRTQVLTVFNRITPASQSILLRTNLPGLRHNYKSFMIEANKRMSGRWQAQMSYQWQREMEETQANSGDPNSRINSYARSSSDNTHAVRTSIVFDLGAGFQLGSRYFYNSGFPYARIVTVRGLGQGNLNVTAEPIGSYKYPPMHEVRFRIDKSLQLVGSHRLRLSFDLLNAFNTDAATSVRNNSTQTVFPFGTLFGAIEGRRGQVAIRYEF